MSGQRGELLLPRFLLPIRPAKTLLEEHAVRVLNGKITHVLPVADAFNQFPDDARVVLDDHVLMPGLINMHTHSPMSLLRGFADDMGLNEWLSQHIWPAEQRWAGEEFVRDGTRLALAEMLRCGTTCFNEMYFFPSVIADEAEKAGLRAAIGVPVIDVRTQWATGLEDCVAKGRAFVEAVNDKPLISAVIAPHATYTVDDKALKAVRDLSVSTDTRVAIHLLEIAWEIEQSQDSYGLKPLSRLDNLGLLNEQLIAVHMVHPDDEDIEQLAKQNVHVVHCPESNLKLASGVSPVSRMLNAGINVSIGTDGAASNNDLDLLGEARTAALLAKGVFSDPYALEAWAVLDLLTINGAKALGLESQLGSIEPGKQADLAAMNLNWPQTQPLHHVHSQLVYAASSAQFTDVWVAGRRVMKQGATTTINTADVLASAKNWRVRMKEGADIDV